MENKAGMFVYALAFLLGVVFVQQWPVLPDISWQKLASKPVYRLLLVTAITLYFVARYTLKNHRLKPCIALTTVVISMIFIGIIYSVLFAKQRLSYQLNEQHASQTILLQGWVSGIPRSHDKAQSFEFNVVDSRLLSAASVSEANKPVTGKIRLSWYYGPQLNAGEHWQLEVRLKPPHGFFNPGGFDYEAWLFQHGLHAAGYVRKSSLNKHFTQSSGGGPKYSWFADIDRLRQSLSQQIDTIASNKTRDNQAEDNSAAMFFLIKALAVGDKSSISKQQWRVLTATGTSHLMAISGLHIGLAALFAYLLIRRLLPESVMKVIPAQHVALSGGMLLAFVYALIAGLSVPTQRAIIMLFVLSTMMLMRRNHRPLDALGFALLVVLLFDPLAVLSAGFWFSFSAVAVIFISLPAHNRDKNKDVNNLAETFYRRIIVNLKRWMKNWLRLQLLISVFLLPLSLLMFQQASLVSPLANLLLIPYVSFLVVPVVLLALCCSFISPVATEFLFTLAAASLDFIWPLLLYLSALPYALWVQGDVGVLKTLLLTFGMLLIFFSKDISSSIANRFLLKSYPKASCWCLRSVLLLMLLPLFIDTRPAMATADYTLAVLDVGQGSAAVIQTKNHTLVFDAGAKFSDKLDVGSSVVIPYLRSQGIKTLDRLIISHGDADHIGGAQAIIDEYPGLDVVGQDLEQLDSASKQACVKGIKWTWDAIDFEFLSPANENEAAHYKEKRNNRSCVLRVSSTAGSVLFTGDIEQKVEQKLLQRYADELAADILMVPHHGSKTSSSAAFIAAVGPEISIISAGYKNRYKLPNSNVMAGYVLSGSRLLQTANSGAITIKLRQGQAMIVEKNRQTAGKYWHHQQTEGLPGL